jgi:cytochrome c oxidase subunit 2
MPYLSGMESECDRRTPIGTSIEAVKAMKFLAIASVALGLALFAAESIAQDVDHGADEYKLCASCHGFKGEGNRRVNAPALAAQEDWYLDRQIRNFRDGVRGTSVDDEHGHTMALMSQGLESDKQIADIVAYIGKLPAPLTDDTVEGDSSRGQGLYAACAACHGTEATGNPALTAPSLVTTGDWYQVRQLNLFKQGLRGAHADDTYGQQMRPLASVLADDAAIRDVVAYIDTLK